jgi:hypothetical protein
MARIHVYTVSCNERAMMSLFMRHYRDFIRAERIFVHYDDSCTDGTEHVARELGAQTIHHPRERNAAGAVPLDDNYLRNLRSTFWHASRGQADWVIVVDTDELVTHPQIHTLLDTASRQDIWVLQPEGWELVGEWPPEGTQVWQTVRRGVVNHYCSKPCVFRPSIDMIFSIGSHDARPTLAGAAVPIHESPQLKMLHCTYLDWDFVLRRHQMRRARAMTPLNAQMGWGKHWKDSDEALRQKWERAHRDAVPIPDLPPAQR